MSNPNPKNKWKKGQPSPNPSGRPPKGNAWSDIAEDMLMATECLVELRFPDGTTKTVVSLNSEVSMRHAIIGKQINMAIDGNLGAAKELADRTCGRPSQALDIQSYKETTQAIPPDPFDGLTTDELREMWAEGRADEAAARAKAESQCPAR